MQASDDTLILHASAVAFGGRGLLILGASGSGKSGLALDLMAWGAQLIADDRTVLSRAEDGVVATAPATIDGLIEARGIGVLPVGSCGAHRIDVVMDLDQREPERIPPARQITFLGQNLPLLHKPDTSHFAAGLLHYLQAGSIAEGWNRT